jgi:hypothetical protein
MTRSAYEALGKSLGELTDENTMLCGVMVSALDEAITTAKKKARSIERIKFSLPNIDGDKITVRVYYD